MPEVPCIIELTPMPSPPDKFQKLCSIEVDLSHLPLTPEPKKNGMGTFYTVKYWVVLKFNSAELKAQMLWMENGVEKR
jgi:hypothetical protein